MITVEEAQALIHANTRDYGIESVPLHEAVDRVLREEIVADRNFPPYHRVTMDGIAIQHQTYEQGTRSFPIEGVAAAGVPQKQLQDPANCMEVMTGAILPGGADSVIRYEDIISADGQATLQIEGIQQGQNVHKEGEDRRKGEVVLKPGRRIAPADIGVCATVGKTHIRVSKLPRTLIISSGDELVEVAETPRPHQIRQSNVYQLHTILSHYNIAVDRAHLPDDLEETKTKLAEFIRDYDLLILSGGVSKGKFDYLPQALEHVGIEKLFHRVMQRPGKPFWFGRKEEEVMVFAFPGNPVSSFMCANVYFRPWLEHSLGLEERHRPVAVLKNPVVFDPDLVYFLEVAISFSSEGQLLADPVKGNGSGDHANLVDADAFIQLPRGKNRFEAGERYPIIPYRSLMIG